MKRFKITLEWNPAIRAALCMLPMVLAFITGNNSIMVPLGQGGFFYSTLALPDKKLIKFIYMFFLLSFGLGMYLLGGNIVFNPWFSFFITFAFSLVIGLISGVRIMAPLAFSLMSIYSAGLNVSNPERLHTNYLGFSFVFAWCGLLSLIPIWKATDISKLQVFSPEENVKVGVRLGIGSAISLFIANLFGFVKLGWPPSAVGSIIRFNEVESKKRAMARVVGTVGGAFLAILTFLLVSNPIVMIMFGYLYGVLHSLFSSTKLGKTVFFYTATILILYSANDFSQGPLLAIQRIIYNLVGVLIAIFIILYPLPRVMKRIDDLLSDLKAG